MLPECGSGIRKTTGCDTIECRRKCGHLQLACCGVLHLEECVRKTALDITNAADGGARHTRWNELLFPFSGGAACQRLLQNGAQCTTMLNARNICTESIVVRDVG